MFSIGELQRFSGIKAHTIRIWEKRYAFPKPERTVNNIRHYSLEQTKQFLDLVLLNLHAGYRISKLASLNTLDIKDRLHNLKGNEERQVRAVYRLILHMHSQETEAFEDLLNDCHQTWGADALMKDIILPFLQKAPLLSYAHTDSTTHFAVTAVRQKIMMAIDSTAPVGAAAPKALLFLPQGEHYDLLLLFLSYLLKAAGIRVLYLGTNISSAVLRQTATEKLPRYFYTYFPANTPPRRAFDAASFAAYLGAQLPGASLCVVSEASVEGEIAPFANVHFTNVHFIEVEDLLRLFKKTVPELGT
jgi:DNA-binding transcriptional MerR regulator